MTQPQMPFGQPRGPQFGHPYRQPPTRSSFGGWGGPPGQFGPPGRMAPPPRKPKGSPPALVGAVVVATIVLLALLAYAFVTSGPRDPGDVGPQYENEDYRVPSVSGDPPDIPLPQTEDEIISFLDDNEIYNHELLAPVRCEVSLDDDVHSLALDELEERLAALSGCLTRSWGPTLEDAGFIAYQPEVTVYPGGSEVQTQCGVLESMNAFYCAGDQNIYVATDITAVMAPANASSRVAYELVMAHEYGHAMQARTGMFVNFNYIASESPEEIALEIGRRAETQADCFAGLTLRSLGESLGVDESDVTDVAAISYDIGDDVLAERFGGNPSEPGGHGTGDSRVLWVERGLGTGEIGTCNTWVAPADEVR